MPVYKCCVVGCASTKSTTKLYTFPRNIHLRSTWAKLILAKTGHQQSSRRSTKICRNHFEDKYICGENKLRHAIPTLFNEEEIRSRLPLQDIIYSEYPTFEVPDSTVVIYQHINLYRY